LTIPGGDQYLFNKLLECGSSGDFEDNAIMCDCVNLIVKENKPVPGSIFWVPEKYRLKYHW
jgi:hypothetical protein